MRLLPIFSLLLSAAVAARGEDLISSLEGLSSSQESISISSRTFSSPVIKDGQFSRFTSLRQLFIDWCNIEEVGDGAIKGTQLRVLRIMSNKLSDIPNLNDVGQTLRILDLSHNNITAINENALKGLAKLEFLKLTGNGIRSMDAEAFKPVALSLVVIDLEKNKLTELPNEVFAGMSSMRRLTLSNNELERASLVMSGLSKLQDLDLSHNNLDMLPDLRLLPSNNNLKTLKMDYNNFENVAAKEIEAMIGNLTQLQNLHMQHTSLTTFPNVSSMNNYFFELAFDLNPLVCSCDLLWLQDNEMPVDPKARIRSVSNMNCSFSSFTEETTAIRINDLTEDTCNYEPTSSTQPPTIQTTPKAFSLSEYLSEKRYSNDTEYISIYRKSFTPAVIKSGQFSEYSSLDYLSIYLCPIDEIEVGAFKGTKLRSFFFGHNNLTKVPGLQDVGNSLKKLNLVPNQIEAIEEDAFSGLVTLEYLDLSENRLISIAENAFKPFASSIQQIYLKENRLMRLPPKLFEGMTSLSFLTLESNILFQLSESLFGLMVLEELDLRNNSLPNISMSGLSNLEQLDLEINNLQNLPDFSQFPKNNSLEILKMDHNKFGRVTSEEIASMLDKVPKLQHLSMQQAGLTTFPNVSKLDNHFQWLAFNLNPLTCTCDLLWIHDRDIPVESGPTWQEPYSYCTIPGETRTIRLQELKERCPHIDNNSVVTTTPRTTTSAPSPNSDPISLSEYLINKGYQSDKEYMSIYGEEFNPPTVKAGQFSRFSKLQQLSFRECNLGGGLEDGALKGTIITRLRIGSSQLSSVPGLKDVGKSLETLSVYSNDIRNIEEGTFEGLVALEYLDMHDNGIESIAEGAFKSVASSVRYIHLEENRLTTLPRNLFDGLGSLIRINLEKNALTSVPDTSSLVSLKYFEVSNNQLEHFDIAMSEMGKLEQVDLHVNNIRHLPPFHQLPKNNSMEMLRLEHNKLDNVTNVQITKMIERLPKLRYLYMHHSGLTTFPDPSNFDNDFTQLRFRLNPLVCSCDLLWIKKPVDQIPIHEWSRIIEYDPYVYCKFPGEASTRRVQELNEETCAAGPQTPSTPSPTTTLAITQAASLSQYLIDRGFTQKDSYISIYGKSFSPAVIKSGQFSQYTNLKYVRLYLCSFEEIENGAFKGTRLKYLFFGNSNFPRVPDLRDVGNTLEKLKLVSNGITTIEMNAFEGLVKLKYLDLSENKIEQIADNAFGPFASTLLGLYLEKNKLTQLPAHLFEGMTSLARLRMEDNAFIHLPESLSGLTSLNVWYLTNNSLRELNISMSGLSSLEYLDMSINNLEHLPDFTQLPSGNKLRSLRMDHNKFSKATSEEILDMLEKAPKLQYLYMQHTGLTAFPDVSKLKNDFRALYFNLNPLECSCDLLWVKNKKIHDYSGPTWSDPFSYCVVPGEARTLRLQEFAAAECPNTDLGTTEVTTIPTPRYTPSGMNLSQYLASRNLNERENIQVYGMAFNPAVVTSGQFSQFQKLKSLYIRYCNFEEVENGAFKGTVLANLAINHAKISHVPSLNDVGESLERLRVEYNYIEAIGEHDFGGLVTLKSLDLSHNRIESIADGAFGPFARSILWIALDDNKLTQLPKRLFEGMTSLTNLYMQKNALTSMPDSSSLGALQYWSVSENQLEMFDVSMSGMSKLKYLSLEANNIKHLPPIDQLPEDNSFEHLVMNHNKLGAVTSLQLKRMVENVPKLRYLYMQHTGLTALPNFSRLSNNFNQLGVELNPLVCSCDLLWLQDTKMTAVSNMAAPYIYCKFPGEASTRRVQELTQQTCAG